ncbi:hypothetical protein LR48_Vigan10g195400 [Vigna angularis]|uniref:Integrase catalytic domain-containing protein n=1 Tax=Phaseolus angularis TaxID=3914 RepID=A0A0L9VMF7_PHAAN|nr:hypothetical protein LR48_Vigan10g195400 [Vigna angularis]
MWDNEDSLIMTWMWHSMVPEISRNYMFHSSAKEIWDDLQNTFSLKKDFAACYDIESRIFNTKQGSHSVSEYHGILNGLWIELDQYQTIKMCKTDAAAHAEVVERGRIFKFLHGLNQEYDPIRVQILGREKLSSLSEVFFMARGEETRRAVMLDGGISNIGSAMTTGKGFHKGTSTGGNSFERGNRGDYYTGGKSFETGNRGDYCSFCRRSGHTKETCFRLHGKSNVLERMRNNKGPTQKWVNHTTSEQEATNQSNVSPPPDLDMKAYKEELDRLKAMVESMSKPSGSCTLSMKGKICLNTVGNMTQGIWILDSGATDHMTPCRVSFNSYDESSKEQLITVANGQGIPICGSGNIVLESSIILKGVLHVPQLANNLISVQKLTKDLNCSVIFFSTHCVFQDLATGKTILTAKEQSGLYLLETNDQSTTNILSLQATSETWANSQIWLHHKRLGHPSFNVIKSLFPHLFTNESVESFNCDICQLSKHHRASYPISNKKSTSPFDLIHTDVWGPVVASISGAKWFVTFIDDCTRVTWTYLMSNKSEVFQIFVKFFHLVQNQFGRNIKRIRSDNGTEYVNHEFLNFFSHNGIVHELTCVNTPQQNGIAERKNRHLLEVTRALLFQMSVPKIYWGEAVLTATYLINRLPTRVLNGISPIESLLSFVPSSPLISSLPSRIFGCIAFVHSHHPNRSKLDPKALKCIFIGYPSNKKGYKCYHPQSRRIFISMDVTFHETQSF